jgi:CTP:molybdopterin cytidylyltransferase MocA
MDGRQPVGAVILAAGSSRRFGGPKQLAVIDGRTLLEHALAAALESGLAPVVAVVPVWLTRPAGWPEQSLRWVRNPFPERGLSLSLRLGLDALGEDAAAAVILLGDQPGVAPLINAVLAGRGDRPLVAVEADGVAGPPVLIERSHFALADRLSGDIGLREVIRAKPDIVRVVSVAAHAADVDTPDDVGRLSPP